MKTVFIVGLVIIAAALGVLFYFAYQNILTKPAKEKGPIQLTYWGFWDEAQIKPLISDFEKIYPNIKVSYIPSSKTFYRSRVQTQIREGSGPDIFQIRSSWLPMFLDDLSPAPADIVTKDEYLLTFYPIAKDSFLSNDQIFAIPLTIDGLALFYNEDILKSAGVSAPSTWQQFLDISVKVTVKEGGQINTAGAALGTTGNIDYWSDILGLLLLQQPGINLSSPSGNKTAEIIRFYTSFIIDPRRKTWDTTLPSSTQMFTSGKLAFYFATFEKVKEIKLANPNLVFGVVPVPQLPGGQVAWASFWGEAVSRTSKHPKEAWQLVKFLSQKGNILRLGVPPSRIDLANTVSDPILQAFTSQGPYYKSWYLNQTIADTGINDEMISVWKEAIDAVLQGITPEDALGSLQPKVQQILDHR